MIGFSRLCVGNGDTDQNTMVLNVVVGLTSLRSMGHEAKLNQENNWKFSKFCTHCGKWVAERTWKTEDLKKKKKTMSI